MGWASRKALLFGLVIAPVLALGCGGAQEPRSDAPWWGPSLERCRGGDDGACLEIEREHLRTVTQEHLREAAEQAGRTACGRGVAEACELLRFAVRSSGERVQFLLRACHLGRWSVCGQLYLRYLQGDPVLGIPREPRVAFDYAVRACMLGRQYCGAPLGVFLRGDLRDDPAGLDRAVGLAFCPREEIEHDGPGCRLERARVYAGLASLGDRLIDFPRALQLLGPTCLEGHWPSCTLQGLLVHQGRGASPDPDAALELWGRACEGGDKDGCYALGRARLIQGPRYDLAAATRAFGSACASSPVCQGSAGRVLAFKRARREAMPLFDAACRGGLAWACADRARLQVLLGTATREDGTVLASACDEENRQACRALGEAYARGVGVPRDPGRAVRYRERAHSLRASTQYWRSVARGLENRGSQTDGVVAAVSLGFVSPLVFGALAAAADDPWDFSEVPYQDP